MKIISKRKRIFENLSGKNNSGNSPVEYDCFLSPENAAKYLDVSVKFIYERIQSGEIQAYSIGNRIKRIRKGALDRWLSTQVAKHER